MPIEYRDQYSQAKLFIPTPEEKRTREMQEQLKKEIEEVQSIKKDYESKMSRLDAIEKALGIGEV